MFMRGTTVAAFVEVPAVAPSVALAPIPMNTRVDVIFIPKFVVLSFFPFVGRLSTFFLLRIWAVGSNVPLAVTSETFQWWETLVFR